MYTDRRARSGVRSSRFFAALGGVGLCLAVGAAAGTEVLVNDGQRLLRSDLEAGIFAGQSFTLGPATTFLINAGGIIGPIGPSGSPPVPFGFSGSTVVVNDGGLFFSNNAPSPEGPSVVSELSLSVPSGGEVGRNFRAGPNSDITLSGGTIGELLQLGDGSSLSMTSGTVGRSFRLEAGSSASISGGVLGSTIVSQGAVLEASGGRFESLILQGGSATLQGGVEVTGGVSATQGVDLTIGGGNFGPLLTGSGSTTTISDGVFIRADLNGTVAIKGGVFGSDTTLGLGASASITGGSFGDRFVSDAPGPLAIRNADFGDSFRTGGTVRLAASSIGNDAVVRGLRIEDGASVGDNLRVDLQSGVDFAFELIDGSIGDNAVIQGGGRLSRVVGGSLGANASFGPLSTLDVTGGSIGAGLSMTGSTLNVRGGTIERGIEIRAGSTLHIFATEIAVDGIPLALLIGESVEIDQVDGASITAILEDGSAFSFQMNIWSQPPGGDRLSFLNTTVMATLVPSPSAAVVIGVGFVVVCGRRRVAR